MPVKVSGQINGKNINFNLKDGSVKTYFLGKREMNPMVIVGCEKTVNGAMAHHLIVHGLLILREGIPMGEHVDNSDYFIVDGQLKLIENSDRILMVNPENRKNTLTASLMPARSKK